MAAKPSAAGFGALRAASDRFAALGRARRFAATASAVWVVLVAAYAIGFFGASQARGTVFLDAAFFLVMLALPLIVVWLAALLGEELARQREMIAALAELVAPLVGALDATRTSLDRRGPAAPAEIRAAVAAGVRAGRGTDAAAARDAPPAAPGAASRDATRPVRLEPPPPEATGQPDLPMLSGPEAEAPLDWDDLMRAFDFPRDESDADGFRALRAALRRRSLAQMLQAAEDVMTLLSQEGVYMEDLAAAPADPEAWRRFIAGARGAAVAGMGGVSDAGALATARGLMKADPIFRDAGLVFQRRFDAVLSEFAARASGAELAQLADTRSGRAFQLLARACGSFDQTGWLSPPMRR